MKLQVGSPVAGVMHIVDFIVQILKEKISKVK